MRKMTAALAALFVMSTPALAGDPAAGKEKSAVCGACHGADGNSPIPDFPRLAGQPEDYLLRALQDYKLGRRKNPIMGAQVEALSKADMADLAAWFSSQQGLVVKR
ncbi:MAG: cytochrome c [Zoogloeaceae bacterium]|nr:cytochrome c [Zoogloeaceae bacterium]